MQNDEEGQNAKENSCFPWEMSHPVSHGVPFPHCCLGETHEVCNEFSLPCCGSHCTPLGVPACIISLLQCGHCAPPPLHLMLLNGPLLCMA